MFAGVLLVASSCRQAGGEASPYYPVDSLIRAQAHQLALWQATLTKQAQINGVDETTTFTPADSTAWLKELDIFTTLNAINKPVFRSYYTVTIEPDKERDLTVCTYTATTDLPVAWLKLLYQDNRQNIRGIEALYREESSLMKGTRMLVMQFQEVNNKISLTSYSLEGGQEIFLGKPVEFTLTGTITVSSWQEASAYR
ncbi:MAG: hypothetical protein HRU69_04040 [Flammeovirgaceae bacterium]|nr:MAG: hypothetical protein HRU69_04040 [Flammeovirgaceae bacterium]